MNEVLSIVALLGVGGIVGAAASAVAVGSRISVDFDAFRSRFSAYMLNRSDNDALELKELFRSLEQELTSLGSAFANLKRALKLRR